MTEKEKEQRPEPDVFTSTGPETKRLLVKVGKRDSSRIYSGCSLRHIPINNNMKTLHNSQLNILVALDGVNSCEIALDWLIDHNKSSKFKESR